MSSSPSKILEVFDNPNEEIDFVIRIDSSEFTCLCPLTGQPDFADIHIEYIADKTNINLGIGTALNTNQLLNLPIHKIKFVVSPGFNKDVAHFCNENNIEYMPGVETSTEIMEAQNYGFDIFKFFPAELAGGVQKLKALRSIFPNVSFMCTGGINLENYKKYIELPNVCSVGGSFILPKKLIKVDNVTEAINHLKLL